MPCCPRGRAARIAVAYGPYLSGQQRSDNHLFLFANASFGVALSDWPPQSELDKLAAIKIGHHSVWAEIDKLIAEPKDVPAAVVGVVHLMGPQGRIKIETAASKWRQHELVPAICALVGHDKAHSRACGLVTVIGLPMPIDLMLADSPPQPNSRGTIIAPIVLGRVARTRTRRTEQRTNTNTP
jgi:hypothetical protein